MSEESEEGEDGTGNSAKFHNNEFYTAIVDEDLEHIEELSKQYGSNFLIKVQDGAPGKVLWKVNVM